MKAEGEGFHHLAFAADDVGEQEKMLVQKGFAVLYSVKFEGGGAAVYFDASKPGGLVDVIEIVKWVPGMMPW